MSGISKPYFYTWTKQKTAPRFTITGTEEFHYINDEKKILDLSSTSFQASFGLQNQLIQNGIIEGTKILPLSSPKAEFTLKEEVSQQLLNLIKLTGRIFWTNSGAESVENALKMARDLSGKKLIASRKTAYHGASLGALSVGGDWRSQVVDTIDQWTIRIPEPDVDPDAKQARAIIEKIKPENIAAICLETITGGNGVIIPPNSWYKGIQEICDDYNIFLILDEVICGLGRTGEDFGFQHYPHLKPDFITMAKAITGGFFPMGALWVKEKLACSYENKKLPCGLTNYAHPIGLACVQATLSYYLQLKNTLPKRLEIFTDELASLKQYGQVRQLGFLAAVELNKELDWQYFIDRGLYLYVNKKMLIIAPALNMPADLLKTGFTIIKSSLE